MSQAQSTTVYGESSENLLVRSLSGHTVLRWAREGGLSIAGATQRESASWSSVAGVSGLEEILRRSNADLRRSDWYEPFTIALTHDELSFDGQRVREVRQTLSEASNEFGGSLRMTLRLRRYRYAYAANRYDCSSACGIHGHFTVRTARGGREGFASCALSSMEQLDSTRLLDTVARAVAQAERLTAVERPSSAASTVIFSGATAGVVLHEVVGHGLEADSALGGSALWEQRDTRLAHDAFTALEDGSLPTAWERVPVDQEGVAVRRRPLVSSGVVVGTISDRNTARRLGLASSSGNGRRASWATKAMPRTRHLVVLPGPDDPESIIARTTDGILVQAIDNAESNVHAGTFALRIREAKEIVRGHLGRTLAGFTLSGGLDDFARIDAIGSDQVPFHAICSRSSQRVPVSGHSPTMRFANLNIRGEGIQ